MTEFDARDRIGTALRALAADLVAEKQRVAALRRENSELKAELDQLRGLRNDPAAERAVCEDGPIQSAIP
jgi:regulator of replication initiation timing